MNEDYSGIERPYNDLLGRSPELGVVAGDNRSQPGAGVSSADALGMDAGTPVKNEQSIADLWIDNKIRSKSWKPRSVGFYLDGQTGYAEFANVYISGGITVIAGGTLGGFTVGSDYLIDLANTFGLASTVTAGDDVRFWAGNTYANRAIAPFRVTESGVVTSTGSSVITSRLSTNFEASGRFTTPVLIGAGAVSFGTSGLSISPGATGTSSASETWFVNQQVFKGSPTFSILVEANVIQNAGTGSSYFGLGAVTVNGSGHTYTTNHAGFKFLKSSGIVLYATQGDGMTEATAILQANIVNSDDIDLILRFNGTSSVTYYWRVNGGAILSSTISTNVPTAISNIIQFSTSNDATAFTYSWYCLSASYER